MHIYMHIYMALLLQETVPETFSNLLDQYYEDFLKGGESCHRGTKQSLYLACGGK